MYTKDKLYRITLRLNEEQFNFVKMQADILDVSPSQFLRMVINSTMAISKSAKEKEEVNLGRENDKTSKHD